MRIKLLIASALLIPVFIAGCLLSGTIVLPPIELEGFGSISNSMQTKQVNLSDLSSDYDDNKDKLKSVDAVTIVGDVVNNGTLETGMDIYLSDEVLTDPDDVEDPAHATLIFVSPTIPAGDTLTLHWADGMDFMRNFNVLFDQIKGDGEFYLYGIPRNSISISYDLEIVITITVGS